MTLDEIAIKHNCDKSSLGHDYCRIYEKYFPLDHKLDIFEIGYGGYDDPNAGGESAKMWYEFGAFLTIIDIYKKINVPAGVLFEQCSGDSPMAKELAKGNNVIIDDGSHINADIITTFKNLWPSLNPGGLYCVEDLHSSYDPYYPDSGEYPANPDTAMSYFTFLSHSVNYPFIMDRDKENYLYDDIEYIHFYKELVIIKKKA